MLRAVDGVDLEIARGEALGLVGESGCGKSTLGRCLAGLQPPTGGEIRYAGETLPAQRARAQRRRMQIVFQDPYSSLNPRMTVGQVLTELLRVHNMVPAARSTTAAASWSSWSGSARGRSPLSAQLLGRPAPARLDRPRPRARPELLVADEPVSALDVSVQATVLNLLDELRTKLGLTMLFIAHNLAVVRHVCDRVAVMYLGRIVETAPTEELFSNPRHPYTQGLLKAVPRLVPGRLSDGAGDGGRPAEPDQRPVGVPVPHPLPDRAGRVLTRRPGASGRVPRPPGRLPLRLRRRPAPASLADQEDQP